MILLQIRCVVRLRCQDWMIYKLKIVEMMGTNDESMGDTDDIEDEILISALCQIG